MRRNQGFFGNDPFEEMFRQQTRAMFGNSGFGMDNDFFGESLFGRMGNMGMMPMLMPGMDPFNDGNRPRRRGNPNQLVQQQQQPFQGGSFFVQSYSSTSTVGPNGVVMQEVHQQSRDSNGRETRMHRKRVGDISESRGFESSGQGAVRMAQQRRHGDRSRTLIRQRESENAEWEQEEQLNEIELDQAESFDAEWQERRNRYNQEFSRAIGYNGNSNRRQRAQREQPLAIENGRNMSRSNRDRSRRRRRQQQYYE